ncbi:hypothetical protein SDC9_76625 [bioreactor metagenome]|uniref:Uncharacterized protein n=1 Tax=bioreactor metagenome TaxID=1076179 RepID=A0A644YUC9_9ZZZZ
MCARLRTLSIYLFEFKLEKSAELGMAQIHGKDYFRKYLLGGKQIVLMGANFDFAQGQVTD